MSKDADSKFWGYAAGIIVPGMASLAARIFSPFLAPANLIMIYLLGVIIVAVRFGRGASVLASFLSVAAYDFFFVNPYLSFAVDDTQYLLTFAMMLGVAVLISTLTTQVRKHAAAVDNAAMEIERERLRSVLLSSISHDLRTPLATIIGASTSLLQQEQTSDKNTRHELVQVVYEEADRMNTLITNLLEMTRLESGHVAVNKEWQAIEEVIGTALARFEQRRPDRTVKVTMPADVLLIPLDAVLIEQVLNNLLDNAAKYTEPGSVIEVSVTSQGKEVLVCVSDDGPGFKSGEEQEVFQKFHRGSAGTRSNGVGLGLAICEGIVKAHGGTITATNRPGGGARLCFSLPLESSPPSIEEEESE